MERGYSRVLVNEIVVTSKNKDPVATAIDVLMMALYSSGERTHQAWERLFSAAGLRITHVWNSPASIDSVIEAELA